MIHHPHIGRPRKTTREAAFGLPSTPAIVSSPDNDRPNAPRGQRGAFALRFAPYITNVSGTAAITTR